MIIIIINVNPFIFSLEDEWSTLEMAEGNVKSMGEGRKGRDKRETH